MGEHRMVVVDGVRYRAEDAERLGLKPGSSASTDTKRGEAKNKARKPVSNKTAEPGPADQE